MIVIQTEHQKNLAKKFGSNGICSDSTHGTNSYDFTLTSLLVVDEFGEGQPIGWCLANHETYLFLKIFSEQIKENSGRIEPTWFMSDLGKIFIHLFG